MIPPDTAQRLAALRRGDLAGARELRLPGLDAVPPEIFGLADTLEVLDLSGGTLTALPDDMRRLTKLRVLFCSGNRFTRLPPVLGACAALSQIGFRATGLVEVPGEALPPGLRWLTLTDNAIEHLPDALGRRPKLQKLMLSGNRLRALPPGLAQAGSLELIRLAANRFEVLPGWLADLPRLAWISYAANPYATAVASSDVVPIPWRDLSLGELLGEGTSGRIHRALWRRGGTAPGQAVAVKLFKGAMTSDGLPEHEMAACEAAGDHPGLTGALGRIVDHQDGAQGLVLRLLPADWRVLAGPPSLESCTRDVYAPALCLTSAIAIRIARAVAEAAAHLHARGILHGDLYAHNILWDRADGNAVLGDFGAASALPQGSGGIALARTEVRAFGLLLGEVLDRAPDVAPDARTLEKACTDPDPVARPTMGEAALALGSL